MGRERNPTTWLCKCVEATVVTARTGGRSEPESDLRETAPCGAVLTTGAGEVRAAEALAICGDEMVHYSLEWASK